MSIKILCTKIPRVVCGRKVVSRNRFAKYNNILTETVNNMKGFIGSESYYPYDPMEDYNMVMSLSEWKSHRDWENWYNSEKRNDIKNEFRDVIEKERIAILRKDDDIFLL